MTRLFAAAVLAALTAGGAVAQIADRVSVVGTLTGQWVLSYDTSGQLAASNAATLGTPIVAGIAVAEDGAVHGAFDVYWLGNSGVLYATGTGAASSLFTRVQYNPSAVAFDSSAHLWVTDRVTLRAFQYTAAHVPLSTLTLTGSATGVTGVTTNSFGEAWFSDNGGTVHHYLTHGTLLGTLATGASVISAIACDQVGHCWVADNTLAGSVWRIDRNHRIVATVRAVKPIDIAVNGDNEVYVLTGTDLLHCTSTGLQLTSVALPSGTFRELALDGNGDVWVINDASTDMYKFDRYTLSRVATMTHAFSAGAATLRGDPSGFVFANTVRRTVDFDGDTVSNLSEIAQGSNPLNAKSTPINPQPIQNGLARVGTTTTLSCRQGIDALIGYAIGGAMNQNGPAGYIQVPKSVRTIPLENDAFFSFVMGNFWLFRNFGGFLDANGTAMGQVTVPNDGHLVGTTWYFAFVTLDNARADIISISSDLPITVQP